MTRTDQPRPVSEEKLERLSARARAKPRIALMGEFSSGKSTLLNLLIGEALLPTKVTATELPPVWFSHGAPRAWWVDRDGRRHDLDFGSFAGVPMSARYVRVHTPSPMLERCDIIDTPGISDPNLEEDSWRFAVGQASFMLWCTSATQAWRETERSTWNSLPERLRANSVLVVTRSDKLGPADREKVRRRLAREMFGLFGGLVLLATPDAVRGQEILTQEGQADLWTASGGAELFERVEAGLGAVRAARLDLLERYASTGPSAPRAVEPLPQAMEPEPQDDEVPLQAADLPVGMAAEEPVRPRRVELPETRRSERPEGTVPDPLNAMRADWMSLRVAEERAVPAPVLRLPDPVRPVRPVWTEPWSEDEDQPLVLDRAWTAAPPPPAAPPEPETEALPTPVPELPAVASADAEEAAHLEAVLSAMAEPDPSPEPVEEPAQALPRAVQIWRDIVARTPEIPPNSPILAMIDQLLCELSRENELSDAAGANPATIIGQTRAA